MRPSAYSLALLAIAGCTGTGLGAGAEDRGRLEIGLGPGTTAVTTQSNEAVETPAPGMGVSQVFVTVDRVDVHSDWDGWKTVRSDPFTVDLLSLQANPIDIATVTLSVGRVTQIRMITSGGSVTTLDGRSHALRVPSGSHTGIKIDGPWFVGTCQLVKVHLEIEPLGSLNVHAPGDRDSWTLNPVIHVAQDQPVLIAECGVAMSLPNKMPGGLVGQP